MSETKKENKKYTDNFKKTIQEYLEKRAATDELFAPVYKKKGKNIDDCITYIFNTVKKSEAQGFTDEEVFSMAVHYYDEDKIDIGSAVDMKVIVNHQVELTDEEKEDARKQAKERLVNEAYNGMKKNVTKSSSSATPKKTEQSSLI